MTDDERTEDYKTRCSSCVFCESDPTAQVGCELGRLEKYIEQGRATLQEDGYYYIDTVCCACRGAEWLKAQPIGKDAIAIVEEEIKIAASFIIVSIDDDLDTIKKMLYRRISECAAQKFVKPKKIIVALKNEEASSKEIYATLQDFAEDIPNLLVRIVNPNYDFARSLDMAVQNVKSNYYCVVQLEHNVPTNMLSTINELVNEQIKPVSMIMPTKHGGYSGLVVQTMLHKIFGGNRVDPIYEKVVEAATLQGKEEQIFNWEDLWIRQKSRS